MMKAMLQEGYGSSEMLRLVDRVIPEPGPGEVTVEVAAAGLDAGLVHLLEGRPFPVRLAMPLRGGRVLGLDCAGRVHAVGEGVNDYAVGDEVFGVTVTGDGALAEYARASAAKLAPKPRGLSFIEAAAIPVSATTALRAVRDAAGVQSGQRVLVLGAAGGVGHFAVQIAKNLGAEVIGACSTGKLQLVRSIGADQVIDYTTGDPLEEGPFDAIIDTGGHRPLRQLRRALQPTGSLVLVGAEPEAAPLGGMGRSLAAALLNPFTRQTLVMLASSEDRQALLDLTELVDRGALRPVIHRTASLEEAPEAITGLGRGSGTAKTVVELQQI